MMQDLDDLEKVQRIVFQGAHHQSHKRSTLQSGLSPGSVTDPQEPFGLLCSGCLKQAPAMGGGSGFYKWLQA